MDLVSKLVPVTDNLKSMAHFIFEKMDSRWTFDFQRMRSQILIPS